MTATTQDEVASNRPSTDSLKGSAGTSATSPSLIEADPEHHHLSSQTSKISLIDHDHDVSDDYEHVSQVSRSGEYVSATSEPISPVPTGTDTSTATETTAIHNDASTLINKTEPGDGSKTPHLKIDDHPEKRARLLFCKSHVAIHPTTFNRDNISGLLGLVEVDKPSARAPIDPSLRRNGQDAWPEGKKETLVFWVPEELVARMDEEDRRGYKRVEERDRIGTKEEDEDDGFVFVSIPPPRGEKYAFSVPVTELYSILVYPPSLSHWYGSATFKLSLMGGVSLPTLFFHDDESPLLLSTTAMGGAIETPSPRSQWGFPPFLSTLERRCTILRSRLVTANANRGGELWLINPSKNDREVHEAGYYEEVKPQIVSANGTHPSARSSPTRSSMSGPPVSPSPSSPTTKAPYPPRPQYPQINVLGQVTPKDSLLVGLSNITNFSRRAALNVFSHPLAKPVVPHLPPAVRSFVTAPGEWERARLDNKIGKNPDVASEFESARLYLARWARVVAEEGEKARHEEVVSRAGHQRRSSVDVTSSASSDDFTSSLGVFSLLPRAWGRSKPTPKPTRTPFHPISARDWDSFVAQGRDELFIRREIFRRGLADGQEPGSKRARREAWEVLLGIVPWNVGGVGGGEVGWKNRRAARDDMRRAKREEYAALKEKWLSNAKEADDAWKEEWHRIDVDCRRTDRNQPMYTVSLEIAHAGDQEKEAGGAAASWDGLNDTEEEGGKASLNRNIAALRTILMTYHMYSPELGYVQGMSDLLSPIFVVFGGNEADAFWGLVGVMAMMESNFLRDQSGMRKQLTTLQQLISVMDPELYTHLERTESLNLFFCFRWILIAFKREFKFEHVIKLWEVLWTNYYSNNFVLFVALAVLQSHRDVLIRYLTEFDEVLKYANDLSGTIDLDTTLAQAEVLFISFRELIEEIDAETAAEEDESTTLRHRRRVSDGGHLISSSPSSEKDKLLQEKEKKVVIGPDLRELLECWRPKGKGKAV